MRIVRNLILLCMLLICQQYIVAQSYNLGKQKQSFAYKTLYANQVVKNNNETTNLQPTSKITTAEDIPMYEQVHKQIDKLVKKAQNIWNYKYNKVFSTYNNIIYSFQHKLTEENIQLITKIQSVVLNYINSETKAYPTLEKQLMNASSTKEEIAIFLSYYKEQ